MRVGIRGDIGNVGVVVTIEVIVVGKTSLLTVSFQPTIRAAFSTVSSAFAETSAAPAASTSRVRRSWWPNRQRSPSGTGWWRLHPRYLYRVANQLYELRLSSWYGCCLPFESQYDWSILISNRALATQKLRHVFIPLLKFTF